MSDAKTEQEQKALTDSISEIDGVLCIVAHVGVCNEIFVGVRGGRNDGNRGNYGSCPILRDVQ